MKKPIIAIDLDDVLARSTEALRVAVNNHLGVDLQPEHYQIPADYWGYYEKVWHAHGIGGKVTLDELDPQMKADQTHIVPMDGAAVVLSNLKEHYQLIIVTARSLNWREATHRWLDIHFPNVFSDVIFADGHKGIQLKNKGVLCKEAGASWLIDDNIEHAQDALEQELSVVLFGDYGWHYKGAPKGVTACKNWQEIEELFGARY